MKIIKCLATGWLSPIDLQEQYGISTSVQSILRLKKRQEKDTHPLPFATQYKDKFHYYADYNPKRFECDFLSQESLKGILLIIDGTINFIDGGKLNSDDTAIRFMQNLKRLREKGATIIFQNHIAKHDNTTSKGNNQLENFSDENIKVERAESVYTLTPKKYRIPDIKQLRLKINKSTFEIEQIFYSNELFNLSDEERMSIKLIVEILNNKIKGLNQSEIIEELYALRDERHLEIVGRNKLWTLLKKFTDKFFVVSRGNGANEKIYTLMKSQETEYIINSILEMDDL